MSTPEMEIFEASEKLMPGIGRTPKDIHLCPGYTRAQLKWIDNKSYENLIIYYRKQLIALHAGANGKEAGFVNSETRNLRMKGVLDGGKDTPPSKR